VASQGGAKLGIEMADQIGTQLDWAVTGVSWIGRAQNEVLFWAVLDAAGALTVA
jgi:hypothetical protein